LAECKQNCGGNTQYLKYKGCYMDADNGERDLPKYIGYMMKPEECFVAARDAGMAYVGL